MARPLFALGLWLGLAAAPPASALPFFVGIGDLPGGVVGSNAYGISGNGAVAVGSSNAAQLQAVRFANGTLSPLGIPQFAEDASFDGSVIVGFGRRWVNGTVSMVLGPNGLPVSTTEGVSSNGAVVVGRTSSGEVYRWENGTAVALGLPAGWTGVGPGAIDVSGDGSRITLTAAQGLDTRMAFLWEAGVFTPLGFAPSGFVSDADAISADGSVIVGTSRGAFRWEGGTIESLGFTTAVDVSGDGSVIVGQLLGQPVVWYGGGIRSLLFDKFQSAGLNLTGWTLENVWAVSDDGLTFAGTGIDPGGNREGWIGHLDLLVPEPGIATLLLAGLFGIWLGRRGLNAGR